MFSTLPVLVHSTHQPFKYAHTPSVPSPLSSSPLQSSPPTSPLSPRNANLPTPRRQLYLMSSPTSTIKSNTQSSGSSYSRRPTKKNPLIHKSGDDGRETRRKLFLKKVREGSEDRRWEARGGDDEMMRTIWIAEQKRRAERQARDAEFVPATQDEEDIEKESFMDDAVPSSSAMSKDEEMAEEVAQQEDAEIEAILSMMEAETNQRSSDQYEERESLYGSDEDEYDNLFMGVIMEESQANLEVSPTNDVDTDMMDMS